MPDFNPDEYLASEDFDPDKYLEHLDKNARVPVSPAMSALAGANQGLTLGGSDEAIGAVKTGFKKLTGDETPTMELYRRLRNEQRVNNAMAKQDNPLSYSGGEAVGSLGLSAIPGAKALAPTAGAGAWSNLGRAALSGALQNIGLSNADITKGPEGLRELNQDFFKGLGTGAATQGVLGVAGKTAEALAPSNLKTLAEEKALKAAIGNNKPALKELNQKGIAGQTGRDLLEDTAATGKPAVQAFSRAKDIAPAVAEKKDFYGKAIGDVGQAIDELSPAAINSQDIVTKLKGQLEKIPATPDTKKARKYLQAQIDLYENTGLQKGASGPASPLPFEEIQRRKEAIKWNQDANKSDAANNTKRILGGSQEEAAARLAADPNTPPDTQAKLDLYKQLKSKWQGANLIAPAAQKKVEADQSNRLFSPSSTATSLATYVADKASGGTGILPLAKSAATGFANQQLLSRGNSTAAVTLDKLADIIQNNPGTLGKFRKVIEDAAKRGPQALIITHQLLSKDPEYMATVGQ